MTAKRKIKPRFETTPGESPEELIAAAYASCFTQTLGRELERIGIGPGQIDTTATVFFTESTGTWNVTEIELETTGHLEADDEIFTRAAEKAMARCQVARMLNVPVKLKAGRARPPSQKAA